MEERLLQCNGLFTFLRLVAEIEIQVKGHEKTRIVTDAGILVYSL